MEHVRRRGWGRTAPHATRSSARTVFGALLLLNASGCMGWRRVPDVLDRGESSRTVGDVRIVLRDGSSRTLREVVVRSDSVIGVDPEVPARVAFPRDAVMTLEEHHFSPGRTAALVVGSAAVLFVTLVAIALILLATEGGASLAPSPAPSTP